MTLFFALAGALAGAFGALVAAQVAGKKYNWSLKFEHAPFGPTLLVLLIVGVAGGSAVNGFTADSAGFFPALLSLVVTAPALIAAAVLSMVAVPCVRQSVDRLSDWVLALTVRGQSKEQQLQKRVDELEATVKELQAR